MSFFKSIFGKSNPIIQSINVIKYPDKFIFETYNKIKNSYSTRSLDVSVLEINSSNKDIGISIIKHLSLSKTINKVSDDERKVNNEVYKKTTGLKTLKAQMKDALNVHISRENNQIHFYPTINGGTAGSRKGFNFSDEKITIEYTENYELIGETLKLALDKCI